MHGHDYQRYPPIYIKNISYLVIGKENQEDHINSISKLLVSL